MRKALVPGSSDPITLGHIAIIESAARLFDSVTVCVMVNEEKKYMFSLKERAELIEKAVSHLENVKVDTWSGWLFEYAEKNGIDVIVKGVRDTIDFEYEYGLYSINREIGGYDTLFVPANPDYKFISSTFVRDMIKYGRDVKPYVPNGVDEYIKQKK